MSKFQVVDGQIIITKEPNDIDEFVLEATRIISKHVEYVIVSGYVAILFGRSRGSEDVDAFIKEISPEKFRSLYDDFVNGGFEWIIDNPAELYTEYLAKGLPVGVWRKGAPLLRIDMKFPFKQSQKGLFNDKVRVVINRESMWIANIESTIAYKEEIAKSDKDILDAKHLRSVFDGLDDQKIENYKKLFSLEFNNAR